MLDEDEYTIAYQLYGKGFESRKPGMTMEERFKPLTDYYRTLTGVEETNPSAIMHHRIRQYGPPCENCGKPYRTPKASFCAACGNKRAGEAG